MIGRSFQKVAVLCPHPDDEYGCAGTISRLVAAGATVQYFAFSRCTESVPEGFPKDVLEQECRRAAAVLGIRADQVWVGNFQVRYFPRDRQDVLEQFVRIRRELAPDLVLAPSTSDVHQDHEVVAQEAWRAFRDATVLGYQIFRNLRTWTPSCFVELDEGDLERKIAALACYKSQQSRKYMTPEIVRSGAITYGQACGYRYAEGFEVIRWLVPRPAR